MFLWSTDEQGQLQAAAVFNLIIHQLFKETVVSFRGRSAV